MSGPGGGDCLRHGGPGQRRLATLMGHSEAVSGSVRKQHAFLGPSGTVRGWGKPLTLTGTGYGLEREVSSAPGMG